MREIDHIVIHCTQTSQDADVDSIRRYWREHNGWKYPGYHFLVKADGAIVPLLSIATPSNGVHDHNAHAIHMAYMGGIDREGNEWDNRTPQQCGALAGLVRGLKAVFTDAVVCGHRDFRGVKKFCPSFDVGDWLNKV